jgi:hypothetical protein
MPGWSPTLRKHPQQWPSLAIMCQKLNELAMNSKNLVESHAIENRQVSALSMAWKGKKGGLKIEG